MSLPAPEEPADRDATEDVETLTSRCVRPACRREFRREVTRGRPQVYCSDTCRGVAEKEYRTARAVVTHYEDALELARADLAAFGRDADRAETAVLTSRGQAEALANARTVAAHARGAAEFAPAGDPRLRDVLQELVAAVTPILGTPGP